MRRSTHSDFHRARPDGITIERLRCRSAHLIAASPGTSPAESGCCFLPEEVACQLCAPIGASPMEAISKQTTESARAILRRTIDRLCRSLPADCRRGRVCWREPAPFSSRAVRRIPILTRASPATQRRAAGISPLVCDSCTTWNLGASFARNRISSAASMSPPPCLVRADGAARLRRSAAPSADICRFAKSSQ